MFRLLKTPACPLSTVGLRRSFIHTSNIVKLNFNSKGKPLLLTRTSPTLSQAPADAQPQSEVKYGSDLSIKNSLIKDFTNKSRTLGSYHWELERGLSILTLPLIGGAMVTGSHPLIDFGLGIVLPLHVHIGLDCIVQDYLPARRAGAIYTVVSWSLRAATVLVLYGCYQFNTNDVGLTAFAKRIWTGKL